MTTVGIVAEWNPFHNGHQRLIDTIRAEEGEACIVSVMSGAFCQRGEAACFDKWLRAEMALAAGVDVVLELPQVYASASLEGFARGGVASLLAFTPLDALYCGSESGDVAALTAQAAYLRTHAAAFDVAMRTAGEQGLNYAQASQEFLRAAGFTSDKNTPNDRLALQYRLALPESVPMRLVQRAVAHDAPEAVAKTMSASQIRAALPESLDEVAPYLPPSSVALMRRTFAEGWQTADTLQFLQALRLLCTSLEAEDIAERLAIRDGWSPRFLAAVQEAADFEDMLNRAQTRHYSRSRVRRLALALLSPLPEAPASPGYCRVLGFSKRGRALLKTRQSEVPLVINTGKDQYKLSPQARSLLLADIHRQALADTLTGRGPMRRDYVEAPRVLLK